MNRITVTLSGVVSGTDDNDYISSNSCDNVTIRGFGGDDEIQNAPIGHHTSNILIDGGDGNDSVEVGDYSGNVTVLAGDGADSIHSTGDDVVIYGGDGNDTIYANYNAKVYGETGDDSITGGSGSNFLYFDGGEGNDYIHFTGSGTVIGGTGNDTLDVDGTATVIGGTGDDVINYVGSVSHNGVLYQYAEGDGNDTITGFGSDDTLQIAADSYATTTVQSVYAYRNYVDLVIQVGDGSITLKRIVELGEEIGSLHITGAQDVTPADTSTETVPADTSTETVPTYSGGNQTISNYSGAKINYTADFTGIGFSDTDFMLNSSTGSLTIQNARDKVIDVAVDNNTVAYAYMASGGGEIDGSSFAPLEVILGGNNADNNILAGSGGSSLWGGVGGSDILVGGNGYDMFFYGKNDGADIISNASSSDTICLYDVNLSDIISAGVSSDMISVSLNTGGSLEIYSAENLSATFKLADGSNWKFHHDSGEWQST